MAGKIEEMIKALDKARSEIAATKIRLAKAEETERELLRQILELCTDEEAVESLWDQGRSADGDFKMVFAVKDRWGAVRGAVVEIKEDFYDWAVHMRHGAVKVGFVHFVQQP